MKNGRVEEGHVVVMTLPSQFLPNLEKKLPYTPWHSNHPHYTLLF